ncbi:host nuclease inhibitor GamL [Hafnia alvei]
MYAYATYDLIEDQHNSAEQAAACRQKWVDDERERILALFPEDLANFLSWNLPAEVRESTYGDSAKELYSTFAWELANQQAERNFRIHDLGWEND